MTESSLRGRPGSGKRPPSSPNTAGPPKIIPPPRSLASLLPNLNQQPSPQQEPPPLLESRRPVSDIITTAPSSQKLPSPPPREKKGLDYGKGRNISSTTATNFSSHRRTSSLDFNKTTKPNPPPSAPDFSTLSVEQARQDIIKKLVYSRDRFGSLGSEEKKQSPLSPPSANDLDSLSPSKDDKPFPIGSRPASKSLPSSRRLGTPPLLDPQPSSTMRPRSRDEMLNTSVSDSFQDPRRPASARDLKPTPPKIPRAQSSRLSVEAQRASRDVDRLSLSLGSYSLPFPFSTEGSLSPCPQKMFPATYLQEASLALNYHFAFHVSGVLDFDKINKGIATVCGLGITPRASPNMVLAVSSPSSPNALSPIKGRSLPYAMAFSPSLPPPLIIKDFEGLSLLDADVNAFLNSLATYTFDTQSSDTPVFQTVYLRFGKESGMILFTFPGVIFDDVSCRIFLFMLSSAFQGLPLDESIGQDCCFIDYALREGSSLRDNSRGIAHMSHFWEDYYFDSPAILSKVKSKALSLFMSDSPNPSPSTPPRSVPLLSPPSSTSSPSPRHLQSPPSFVYPYSHSFAFNVSEDTIAMFSTLFVLPFSRTIPESEFSLYFILSCYVICLHHLTQTSAFFIKATASLRPLCPGGATTGPFGVDFPFYVDAISPNSFLDLFLTIYDNMSACSRYIQYPYHKFRKDLDFSCPVQFRYYQHSSVDKFGGGAPFSLPFENDIGSLRPQGISSEPFDCCLVLFELLEEGCEGLSLHGAISSTRTHPQTLPMLRRLGTLLEHIIEEVAVEPHILLSKLRSKLPVD